MVATLDDVVSELKAVKRLLKKQYTKEQGDNITGDAE